MLLVVHKMFENQPSFQGFSILIDWSVCISMRSWYLPWNVMLGWQQLTVIFFLSVKSLEIDLLLPKYMSLPFLLGRFIRGLISLYLRENSLSCSLIGIHPRKKGSNWSCPFSLKLKAQYYLSFHTSLPVLVLLLTSDEQCLIGMVLVPGFT